MLRSNMGLSKPSVLVYGALVVAVLVLVYSVTSQPTDANPQVGDNTIEAQNSPSKIHAHVNQVADSHQSLPYVSKLGPLPSSLHGAQMRMKLAVDEDGHLRISGDLKDLMDFFLSAVDDEDLELILARIDEYLEFHLEEPALSEARTSLDSYIALKVALFDLEQELAESRALSGTPSSMFGAEALVALEQQLHERNALRAQLLSPEMHEAFYGRSEAYDAFMLEQFKVKANPNLNAEQKAQMLEQTELNADPEIIASRRASMPVQILAQETERLRASGGSEQEVHQLRVGLYGDDAAQRLEQLDRDRDAWSQRISTYYSEKDELSQSSGLSGPELEAAITDLRAESFDSSEQIRVKLMENRQAANF